MQEVWVHRAVLHYVIVHFDISLCSLIRPYSHHRSSRQPLNVSTYNELNWIIFYFYLFFWHLPYLCLSDKPANCFIMDSSQLLQFNTDSNNQYVLASNCVINKWLISLSNKCNTVISSSSTNCILFIAAHEKDEALSYIDLVWIQYFSVLSPNIYQKQWAMYWSSPSASTMDVSFMPTSLHLWQWL